MAEPKTRPSDGSVKVFIDAIADEGRRRDCRALAGIMRKITGSRPRMWGSSIVGFGSYHYKYASGREGDWFLAGFSPRKSDLTLYLMPGLDGFEALLGKLGKHKTGKACLYIKSLDDVRLPVLEQLVRRSVRCLRELYR